MNRPLFRTLSLLGTLLLGGCLGDTSTDDDFRQELVVEGRIEEGKGAEVMLTLSFPYTGILDEATLDAAVVRWAKVTVAADDEEEVLTGYYDRNVPTRFVYRGHRITGRVGRVYRLTVEYSGRTLRAETSIPSPAELDEVHAEAEGDSLFTVEARFRSRPDEAYLFECRVTGTPYFKPALLGVVDGSLFPSGEARVRVNRPIDYVHIRDYTPSFRRGEEVEVRFSSLGPFAYSYWSLLENEVLNALNPLFPSVVNLPTNVEGGRGIWCGYASRCCRIADPRDP